MDNQVVNTSATTYSTIKKMSPQLLVADLDRSIEFYTKKLGFDVEFRYEDFYAGIMKDGFSIHLKSGNPSAEERKNKRKNEDLDIVFSVEGVENLYSEFLNRAVEMVQQLCDRPYGKEFYIADPDGYILAFLEEAG
jgi:catechol 2,3-dioxygenase-like lactoylglutathione lyase family enzyme